MPYKGEHTEGVALFPAFVACLTILQATESWMGSGNEATEGDGRGSEGQQSCVWLEGVSVLYYMYFMW